MILALGIDPSLPQHEKLDALLERGCIDLDSDYLPTYRQYIEDGPGVPLQDIWAYQPYTKGLLRGTEDEIDRDVKWIPGRDRSERTGYPTQKPLALYERIIRASSNEGDVVLDPFAGCATTCVAAERLGRQWVGMDIWDEAHNLIEKRMRDEVGLFGDVTFTDQLPDRTDDGETASPFLRVKVRVKEPDGPKWTRAEMYEHLLEQNGPTCQGCDRNFDDPRYLGLDHNTPRSDGGLNHISNRILLCGPCNRLKSNTYTLSGLRRQNKKRH
ncbi:MAG: DNA methyltransferase [Gammaproteobacteria bacterium]|nr:DNA methyltransferase [Gammaproteobacteria bacterium]